jgi:hypothetical protein
MYIPNLTSHSLNSHNLSKSLINLPSLAYPIYIIKELVPVKSWSKNKKSTTAAFWEGIFLMEFFNGIFLIKSHLLESALTHRERERGGGEKERRERER